jgi:iron complex transport system substrate-binding protein
MRAFIFLLILIYSSFASAIECNKLKILRSYKPKYSNAFSIHYYSNFKILKIGGDSILLKNKNLKLDCIPSEYVFETPVNRVILTSTTHLPALLMLSQEKTLIGFQNKKYIYSNQFIQNQIANISLPLVPEELFNLKSDLIMFYELDTTINKTLTKMRKLNLPVVLNNDYKETSALGRAEWLVYISSFYEQEEKALAILADIEKNYNGIKRKTSKIKAKKKILVGEIQAGKWVMCGDKSDLGQLIKDAGGELVFKNNDAKTHTLSLEQIYAKPLSIDIWLTQNNWKESKEKEHDTRYNNLNTSRVFNYQRRTNEVGANDYWEMGMARPDMMLLEYASIFYPEIFTNHELIWYKKI